MGRIEEILSKATVYIEGLSAGAAETDELEKSSATSRKVPT